MLGEELGLLLALLPGTAEDDGLRLGAHALETELQETIGAGINRLQPARCKPVRAKLPELKTGAVLSNHDVFFELHRPGRGLEELGVEPAREVGRIRKGCRHCDDRHDVGRRRVSKRLLGIPSLPLQHVRSNT